MPWELTIGRRDGLPLGVRDAVHQPIGTVFAGVQFYREPSGPEKIAAARQAGVEFPDFLRQHLEGQAATEQADMDGNGFFVRFFLGSEPVITAIEVEVRGDTGRAVPLLQALACQTGWAIDQIGFHGEEPLFQ